MSRWLLALPAVLLAFALALPATAVAAEPTSGYGSEPPRPEPPKTPEPKPAPRPEPPKPEPKKGEEHEHNSETAPSGEATKPRFEEEGGEKPVSQRAPAKASTLPFTGFDVGWDIGSGVLLMGSGFSIVVAQRRDKRKQRR